MGSSRNSPSVQSPHGFFMRDSDVLFDVAKKFLGEPNQYSLANNKRALNWRVMDNFRQHTITIEHLHGSCHLEIAWEQEHFGNGNCVSVNLNTFKSDWRDRMFNFVESVEGGLLILH